MRIAVITTLYLRPFVANAIEKLRPDCETELFVYHDFGHVGELYLEIEDRFDGFLVSGSIPRRAIIDRVGQPVKPVMMFGTDLQSYSEVFFKLIYRYGAGLERGYFDFADWAPNSKPLTHYLAEGTFGEYYAQLNERIGGMSLAEIASTEKRILDKHIRLWQAGKIDFSTTRLSSIAPYLEDAGVNFYFIYPHLGVIEEAFESLMQEVHLRGMRTNQTSAIRVTFRQADRVLLSEGELRRELDRLGKQLRQFSKDHMADFRLQQMPYGYEVYTSYKTIRKITEKFRVCMLKAYLRDRLGVTFCIGYGIGGTLQQALSHAASANAESVISADSHSYLTSEQGEVIGPLGQRQPLVVPSKVTPHVLALSRRLNLSTRTIQKILSVMKMTGSDEVTPQSLASAMAITVRSANRFLKNLVEHGGAVVSYERQNASRGRPERVYKLLLRELAEEPSQGNA